MKVTYCGRDVSQEVRQNKLNIAAGKNIVFYLSLGMRITEKEKAI